MIKCFGTKGCKIPVKLSDRFDMGKVSIGRKYLTFLKEEILFLEDTDELCQYLKELSNVKVLYVVDCREIHFVGSDDVVDISELANLLFMEDYEWENSLDSGSRLEFDDNFRDEDDVTSILTDSFTLYSQKIVDAYFGEYKDILSKLPKEVLEGLAYPDIKLAIKYIEDMEAGNLPDGYVADVSDIKDACWRTKITDKLISKGIHTSYEQVLKRLPKSLIKDCKDIDEILDIYCKINNIKSPEYYSDFSKFMNEPETEVSNEEVTEVSNEEVTEVSNEEEIKETPAEEEVIKETSSNVAHTEEESITSEVEELFNNVSTQGVDEELVNNLFDVEEEIPSEEESSFQEEISPIEEVAVTEEISQVEEFSYSLDKLMDLVRAYLVIEQLDVDAVLGSMPYTEIKDIAMNVHSYVARMKPNCSIRNMTNYLTGVNNILHFIK